MSIGKKILIVVSLLITCALGIQAFIFTQMVGAELERSVTANMAAKAQATTESFDGLLQAAEADLSVIGAHKAIENYLTFRVFGDEDGMTESVQELELFLSRVFRGKPQYINMQVVDRDGVVLHLKDGKRMEAFEAYDSARAFAAIDQAVSSGESTVSHMILKAGDSVALLSVGPVIVENKPEALIWMYQPLNKALEALLRGANQNGLSAVVSNNDNEIITQSSDIDTAQAQALTTGDLRGWVSIAQELPALKWRVIFGAKESTAFAVVDKLRMISVGVFIAALLISALILVLLLRRIVSPLHKAVEVADSIASGDLCKEFDIGSSDETGQLLNAMKCMQTNLKTSIEEDRRRAAETERIKTALDNVSGCVMVADAKGKIMYINRALEKMFHDTERQLHGALPDFSTVSLQGSDLDGLFESLSRQGVRLSQIANQHNTEFEIGRCIFRTVANPVFDKQGERLGTAVEWTDRSAEVAVEREVQSIVEHAQSGQLAKRIDTEDKDGFFLKLSHGLNALMEVSERMINDTLRVLGAMARGDLTETIDSQYLGSFEQLKNDANATVAKLTEVIGRIKTGAESVSGGANEISQGNTDLSQRTEEQAASLEETASSMEQMTSTVKQNADNARQANQLASGAREQAEKSGQVVGEAVSAMSEISSASKKIADIIGVIDEIAFQTNLLALNAAVEAARAGEQGRGFAVVASEVRNLAQRSATAAKEIKSLIQDSVGKVEQGSALVDQSGQTLQEIVTAVKRVSDIIAEIAAASHEQSTGIEEVNKAIMQMDDMTQQNAALVEQSAAASEGMNEQASGMKKMMDFFRLDAAAVQAVAGTVSVEGLDIAGIDFGATRSKHLMWKSRLRRFLDGKESMSKDQAVSHKACDLGKWLYPEALAQYGHMQEMQELEKVHKQLHEIIHRIVDLKHAGKTDQAEREFERVEPISHQIVSLLNGVEQHVRQDDEQAPKQGWSA